MKIPFALPAFLLAALFSRSFGQLETKVLPTARDAKTDWAYSTEAPAIDWYDVAYDASAWTTGPGGFGTEGTPGAVIGTTWNTPDIWIRKAFTLPEGTDLENLSWKIHHDEAVQIYLNGVLVYQANDYTTDYVTEAFGPDARAAVKAGENVLAIHCSQTDGGQYIDVGLVAAKTLDLVEILPDSRQGGQDWSYSLEEPGTSTWMTAGYSAEAWSQGKGGFGNLLDGMDQTVVAGTAWTGSDIWLRKTFTVPEKTYTDFVFNIFYDEDLEVFLNGTLVLARSGYVTTYKQEALAAEFNSLIKPGENLIAIHCRQTTGGQFIDVGISAVEAVPTAIARAGARPVQGKVQVLRGRSGGMGVQSRAFGRGAFYDFNGRWSPIRP